MENLNELLRPLVEKAINGLEKGTEFVIEQAPELVQEFYNWQFYENMFIFVGCLIGIVQVFTLRASIKRFKEYKDDVLDMVKVVTQPMIACFAVVWFIISSLKLIKLIVAPKLYLIEYFIN